MSEIKLMDLVVPRNAREWRIGRVIGMKRFDLSIGPILVIREMENKKIVEEMATNVDKLVIVKK